MRRVFFRKFLIAGWIIQPNTRGIKRMRNRNIIYIATVIIIVVIASSAFLYINHKSPSQTSSQKNITLLDDEGYTTNLTAPAQRIVSLAPSCTQIVYAIGQGSKVVGVTTYDDYPYNFSAWAARQHDNRRRLRNTKHGSHSVASP